MNALPADSLLIRVLTAVSTSLLAGLGWLISKGSSVDSRLVKVEVLQSTYERRFDELSTKIDGVGDKLDILPRLDETLKNLTRVCETIVPRSEWELNNKMQDERMDRMDRDAA